MSEHKLITLADVARMAARTGHSAFSPSASKMWLTCSGSLIPNILAEDETSFEAAEGTVAHEVGEEWLRTGRRPKHLIGEVRRVPVNVDDPEAGEHEIEITAEMMAYVGDYVAWCFELEWDAVEFLVETRVDFSELTPIPNQGGTSDFIAIVPISKDKYRLVVRDLKYGKGVRVIAEENSQGLLYAYGAYKIYRDKYNIVEIEIGICHPRLVEGTTTYTINPDELLAFAEHVAERAAAAWEFDAPRTPSDAGCQWCKIRGTCAALYEHLAEVTSGVFDDDEPFDSSYTAKEQRKANKKLEDDLGPEPFKPADYTKLSTAALAKILRYRSIMEKYFASIEVELLDRAISDEEDIPGWKLVEGRTRRKWPDNFALVFRKLKELGLKEGSILVEDLISPAQVEAKLHAKAGLSKESAKSLVNDLAIKPPGPKSLVRTSDPRDALPSDADVFLDDEPFERKTSKP